MTVEVTLFGFELDIVRRCKVADPPPLRINRPVMRRLSVQPVEDDAYPTMPVEVYEYQGMGIYRRVQ